MAFTLNAYFVCEWNCQIFPSVFLKFLGCWVFLLKLTTLVPDAKVINFCKHILYTLHTTLTFPYSYSYNFRSYINYEINLRDV